MEYQIRPIPYSDGVKVTTNEISSKVSSCDLGYLYERFLTWIKGFVPGVPKLFIVCQIS